MYQQMNLDSEKLVSEINQLLRIDDVPYHLTNLVTERRDMEHRGVMRPHIITVAYPKIIMRESEVLHSTAMEPALQLLRNPGFATANTEFLTALEDYRKGDYSDCLTKCGSAFESFMKIVCDKRGWSYKQTDTAAPLIKTILQNTTLEGYFEQLLIIVATLRNKLSSAHGGGTTPKLVSRQLAQYATNVTASAMILIAAETGL
jgi:hypothetical protein